MNKFLIAFLSLLLTAGCSSEKSQPAAAPETVHDVALFTTATVPVPDVVSAIGTVQASDTAQLSAQTMGNVLSVNVREGDPISRGQVLAIIDPSQSQAALERAQAALSAARHELAAAQSQRTLAESTLKRYDTLLQRKSVSPQEYDEVKARAQGASARTEAAQAGQAQAQAAVAQAQTALGFTKIRAPFNGYVTGRHVDPGALATPGMPLLTVESTGSYRLETTVDEASLHFVKLGQSVPVVLDAYPDKQLSGKVTQIVPSADPASRTFTVKLELPHDPNLRSGLSGRANFSRGERNSLAVPRSAVVDRGALKAVYVVGPDQVASLRYVTIGNTVGDRLEVLAGLSPNESVVLSPDDRDLGGKKVEVR